MMVCEACQVGRLRPTTITHVISRGGRAVVIPHTPALSCDSCHDTHISPPFLTLIERLLDGRENGRPGAGPSYSPSITPTLPWSPGGRSQ